MIGIGVTLEYQIDWIPLTVDWIWVGLHGNNWISPCCWD